VPVSGSGFDDDAYIKAGAKRIDTPKEIYDTADMVMHVKEPLPPEYDLIREGPDRIHLPAPGRRRSPDPGVD
jgi:alanine dehydrogenase